MLNMGNEEGTSQTNGEAATAGIKPHYIQSRDDRNDYLYIHDFNNQVKRIGKEDYGLYVLKGKSLQHAQLTTIMNKWCE
ncbi:hypothetical protein KY290_037241 [Solanum tuberosum]|uniref:Uncharacterized protein n=1 Tax=Solanum tuberosum TaxID=4113 RepID=A0ABQ7TUY1_SOLTU|nr:hypothetical protein KY285_036544 [Solanum tuberosum]KAH0738536.1 hypothetical protein KY290_037241 [Solanum tuberosum]